MTRRTGLGRGLDALLPPEVPRPDADRGPTELPVDDIDPNPRQPRRAFDEERIAELAGSMRALGVLQPLLVRRAGSRHELVVGERRLRAARLAGLERVPVVVVETDERGSLERALVENLQREDLNPIEEALALRQLQDEAGLTQEALGRRLGRSRVAVTNSLRLLELPLPIQQLLAEGRLSAAHGKALVGLGGNPLQERMARRVAHEGLSVRETEELVRRYQAMVAPASGARRRPERPPAAGEAQRRLADHLQARVRVETGTRKGRIVVDFTSLEELERITAVMLGEAPGAEASVIRLDP
jgi:ParB family chromosome partitioning protein